MRSIFSRVELGAVPTSTHRAVVRAGVVGAWMCTIAFLIAWLITGESHWFTEGIGPLATSLLFTGQVVFKREDAVFTLLSGAAVVVVVFSLIGTPDTSVAAVISLWVFAVTATFFVERRPIAFILSVAFCLAVAPSAWTGRVTSPLSVGLVLMLSFVITAILIFSVRTASTRSESRYRRLFTTAPVALLEQEWTDAIDHLESIGVTSEAELRDAISDIEVLSEVMSRVRILQMNAKARAAMGLGPEEDPITLPRSRVHETSAPAMRQQVVAMWQGKPRFEVEYLTHPDGDPGTDMWVRVEVVSTEIGEHSRRIVISVTDITQLKEAQNTLEELVRSKDEFIASISHELRTPLTGVMGLSAALLDGRVTEEEEREALLEVVVKQSEEISYLVEDLLVGARADIGTIAIRPEALDLRSEIEAVFAGMDSPVPMEVRSEVVAWADPVRVRQIIRNLAVNAGRYGGVNQKAIIDEREGAAVFEMFDSGDPIPEEARERIFQPYGRAHREAGTTASVGLGLAVSRQLANLMGGSLEYLYDGGSVFRLTLPAEQRAEPTRVDDAGKAPAHR
jgi:signal transduction histidine kinase